jgi:hypothetical protein
MYNKKIVQYYVKYFNSINNKKELLKKYIEYFILPNFFIIFKEQYNITMVDILGGIFTKNKVVFSGTVDLHLPYEIINNIIIKKNNIKHPKAIDNTLNNIIKDDYSNNEIRYSFFGEKTMMPKIIFSNSNDIENECIYFLKSDKIKDYNALIDVAGFLIITPKIKIIEILYNSTNKNILFVDDDYTKKIFDGKFYKEYNLEIDNIFIYYDNKNTIGVDFKQPDEMKGLVTIDRKNTITDVAQGIFRLRKIFYCIFMHHYQIYLC